MGYGVITFSVECAPLNSDPPLLPFEAHTPLQKAKHNLERSQFPLPVVFRVDQLLAALNIFARFLDFS